MSSEVDRLEREAMAARSGAQLAETRRRLLEALAQRREGGAEVELARVLRALGELERRLPDAEAARRRYEEAVAILRRAEEPERLAHTVRHLGDVHFDAGRLHLAGPCYEEALALYRAHPDTRPVDLANAIRRLALLRDELGDSAAARRLWVEVRDLYLAAGINAGVAESAARLALSASRQGDRARGLDLLDEAEGAARASGDAETLQYVREVAASIEREP